MRAFTELLAQLVDMSQPPGTRLDEHELVIAQQGDDPPACRLGLGLQQEARAEVDKDRRIPAV